MRIQPTPAVGQTARRTRRPRGRALLAALPDPAEQEQLAAEADRLSRRLLEEADAAGQPLLDALGRRRSPVTLPEYRAGRAPANKGKKFPAEILTGREVQAILDALPRSGPAAARNRALIVIMWRGGLRVSEALALHAKDLDLESGAVTVLRGKGAKRRVAAIDRLACRYLEAWELERAALCPGGDAPFFCGTIEGAVGRPVSRSYVTEMLKRYAKRAGVQKRVHPHGLRHTHAFELSQENVPVYDIQAQLGHQDLAMTAHYIDHLSPKERLERIGARSWGEIPIVEPANRAAISSGATVRAPAFHEPSLDPPEPKHRALGRAPAGEGPKRVLEVIAHNGGAATQAQLRRALGLPPSATLKHLHRLQEQRLILRAGMDHNRSVIWKLAPPPVVMHPVHDYRQAPRGEGSRRILDAIEAAGGRASQTQLAALLGIATGTVHSHCLALEAAGQLERGGLDKSTSHRGSQVWLLQTTRARYTAGGYSMRVTLPAR